MTQEATTENKEVNEEVVLNGRVADIDKALQEQRQKEIEAAKTPEQKSKEEAEAKAKAEQEAAAKAKEEADKAEAEKKKAEEEEKWKAEWLTIDNPHAQAAIDLMKEAGMKPVEAAEIFDEAIKAGDLTKVRWDLLEARLGGAKTLMVKTGIETYYNTEYDAQQKLVAYAHEQVGGEAGWDKVKTWAQRVEKSDKEFAANLKEWRAAIKVGGFAGRAAVDAIKGAYEKHPDNGSLKNPPLERGNTTPNGTSLETPLSRAAYFEALQKAGGDRAPKAVQDALFARRQAGIKAGI